MAAAVEEHKLQVEGTARGWGFGQGGGSGRAVLRDHWKDWQHHRAGQLPAALAQRHLHERWRATHCANRVGWNLQNSRGIMHAWGEQGA